MDWRQRTHRLWQILNCPPINHIYRENNTRAHGFSKKVSVQISGICIFSSTRMGCRSGTRLFQFLDWYTATGTAAIFLSHNYIFCILITYLSSFRPYLFDIVVFFQLFRCFWRLFISPQDMISLGFHTDPSLPYMQTCSPSYVLQASLIINTTSDQLRVDIFIMRAGLILKLIQCTRPSSHQASLIHTFSVHISVCFCTQASLSSCLHKRASLIHTFSVHIAVCFYTQASLSTCLHKRACYMRIIAVPCDRDHFLSASSLTSSVLIPVCHVFM